MNDEHTPLIAQDAPQSRTARAAKVAIATLAIAGACATAANVTPKAGARASLGDASAQLGSPAIKTPKAITTHSEANMAIAKDVAAALGYKTALVLPTGAAPMVQYHLHLGRVGEGAFGEFLDVPGRRGAIGVSQLRRE